MKATQANFLQFLEGNKQFIIPIYQRTYSWTQKQCLQLWNDIVRVAKRDDIPAHFIGSIVYIEGGIYQVSSVPTLLVIDGQQRLTTLTLLLKAIAHKLDSNPDFELDISEEEIINYYLLNILKKDNLRYKLLLTQSDEETLKRLLENKELPANPSHQMIDNFHFFQKQIDKDEVLIADLYKGLMKLVIVDVSLDRTQDNPQLIFESLNSTGLDLTQADLIRNYVLMGLEPDQQKQLYQDYWYPMEQSFGHREYVRQFDRFMRDYLTIKNEGTIPRINEVYDEFKTFVRKKYPKDIGGVVENVYRYSKNFVRLAFLQEPDIDIRNILADINALKVDVAYPFLLEVIDDYEQELIPRDELLEILKIVESYVFRRVICGIPTNSLNKTFATLSKELDKDNYLESSKAAFLLKDSYRRFPSDEEFRQEFVVKDVYNFRSRNYLLRKMENFERKEFVDVDEYTIEHIMPQNEDLSEAWIEELGDDWPQVQERYLHTIGNLTLTGYNSELSDRPFTEKRDMKGGFAESPIRLNHGLAGLDSWNAETIIVRAKEISQIALTVWYAPELSKDTIKHYKEEKSPKRPERYTLEQFEYLDGPMLELFQALRIRILNIDSSVQEEMKKYYIAYKTTTNFVDIDPQKSRLRLSLNMPFSEIDDPKGVCKDITDLGRWGNGDVEFGVSSKGEFDYAMFLIQQSFEKHWDGGNGQLF